MTSRPPPNDLCPLKTSAQISTFLVRTGKGTMAPMYGHNGSPQMAKHRGAGSALHHHSVPGLQPGTGNTWLACQVSPPSTQWDKEAPDPKREGVCFLFQHDLPHPHPHPGSPDAPPAVVIQGGGWEREARLPWASGTRGTGGQVQPAPAPRLEKHGDGSATCLGESPW